MLLVVFITCKDMIWILHASASTIELEPSVSTAKAHLLVDTKIAPAELRDTRVLLSPTPEINTPYPHSGFGQDNNRSTLSCSPGLATGSYTPPLAMPEHIMSSDVLIQALSILESRKPIGHGGNCLR